MEKITFILNTTAADFAGWLEKHTSRITLDAGKRIPTDYGRITLQAAHRQGDWINPASIIMNGFWISDGVGEDGSYHAIDLDECIRFDFSRLAADRVEVTGSYSEPAVRAIYAELLLEISRRWPEAIPPSTDMEPMQEQVIHDSGHYSYPPDERKEIGAKARKDKKAGKIMKQESWAQNNYGICWKTVNNYMKEFPELET
jgi:hypothetical protein